MVRYRRQQGFSLVELLIVTAIIGLLASIMIPNLIDAMHKARQKRTMTDIRGIGIGWMSWQADQTGAASAGQSVYYQTDLADVDYPTMWLHLHPTDTFFYVVEMPDVDPWGTPYVFRKTAGGGSNSIFICSAGRDQVFSICQEDPVPVGVFLSTDYDQDIVWADGFFVRWPNGLR